MSVFDYCFIAINIFTLGWILYKLNSIEKDNNTNYFQLEAKIKRLEQLFSAESNNIKSIIAKTSNKLDGVIYRLDNQKKTISNVENQISSFHSEEQRLVQSIYEKLVSHNSLLSQNTQAIISKLKSVASSNAALNQLMRDTLDKSNQISYGIDSISAIQTNNQKVLIENFDKVNKHEESSFQLTKMAIASLQKDIKKQEDLLQPLESFIIDLTELYGSLEKTIEDIHQKEKSLSTMANKHETLIESVKKLNQTSIEVFEILKLYILNCSLSPFEKNLTKRQR